MQSSKRSRKDALEVGGANARKDKAVTGEPLACKTDVTVVEPAALLRWLLPTSVRQGRGWCLEVNWHGWSKPAGSGP